MVMLPKTVESDNVGLRGGESERGGVEKRR
jgi:hypothetical protein